MRESTCLKISVEGEYKAAAYLLWRLLRQLLQEISHDERLFSCGSWTGRVACNMCQCVGKRDMKDVKKHYIYIFLIEYYSAHSINHVSYRAAMPPSKVCSASKQIRLMRLPSIAVCASNKRNIFPHKYQNQLAPPPSFQNELGWFAFAYRCNSCIHAQYQHGRLNSPY